MIFYDWKTKCFLLLNFRSLSYFSLRAPWVASLRFETFKGCLLLFINDWFSLFEGRFLRSKVKIEHLPVILI